jgi:enterochelin esterase-like enzyme
VSHGGAAARHDDFVCRPEYNAFLRDEVLPSLEADRDQAPPLLVGLSLSPLAAAFAVLACPAAFLRAVCQSPSAWQNGEWLARRAAGGPGRAGRYDLGVGSEETEADVRHAPSGMLQGTSQVESVRRFAAELERQGHQVRMWTIAGGHDPACWTEDLPAALAWATEGAAV